MYVILGVESEVAKEKGELTLKELMNNPTVVAEAVRILLRVAVLPILHPGHPVNLRL